ncbi:MAG TPA: dipeptidase [Candidatus Limnocylindrales bacterium]|nr:dipeptidase [Candidatus Limnocylindrales bacterium]
MKLDSTFRYLADNRDRLVDELVQFLKIPSISAHKDRDADVAAALDYDKRKLESLGFKTQVWPTRAHAGLFAERIENPDLPTVLIYGHVDVQPVDPLELWETPPFEPRIKDGKIWARGADDNKGQHYAQIAGVEAAIHGGGGLPVNVKFIIESDEEYDGEAMAAELPKHKDQLKCDAIVVSDSSMPDLDHPALTTYLRGIQTFEVTVTGPAVDKHSGEWGGMLYEPIDVLRWVAQNLKDFKTGRVLVPGFYDDVLVPPAGERAMMNSAPWNDAAKAREIGVTRLFHEEGFTPRESGVIRPTLQINGIWGGYTGAGFKTVIGNQAHAKISTRLVHNQDPERIGDLVEKAIRDLVGDMGTVTIKRFGAGLPFLADLENPYVRAGLKALESGFGKPAVVMGMGGSIPIVAPLVKTTGAPCVLMGFGLPGDNLHAPNEHFALDSYFGGARSAAAYLNAVGARVGAASPR